MRILPAMMCLLIAAAPAYAATDGAVSPMDHSLREAHQAALKEATEKQRPAVRFGSELTEREKENISKAALSAAVVRMHRFGHASVTEKDVVDGLLLHFQTKMYLSGKYTSENMRRAGVEGDNYEGDLHLRALMSVFFMLTPQAYRNFSYDVHDYVEVRNWADYTQIGQYYTDEVCAALKQLADPETSDEEFRNLLADLF